MKIIKKIIIAVAISGGVFFMVAFLLPNTWAASHTLLMAANKDKIYELVANLRNWNRWSVMEEDSWHYKYEGITKGKGAERSWTIEHLGTGYLKFFDANPDNGISYYIVFIKDHLITSTSTGEITFETSGNQTKVVWTERGDSKNIIEKLMHLFFGNMLQDDMMVDSLRLLKRIVERV